MHDLDDTRSGEGASQRREIGQRQWIDAACVAGVRHLHEAQLGAIGPLPQEFGVQANGLEGFEVRAKLGKSG